jgi:hypothetical protein
LNRKKENSKSKLSKASKKSASSYFVRATKHIVKAFDVTRSNKQSLSKSDPSSTSTSTGIQSKKKEDNDTGNISIELTRTFDSVDDDLAEDVDINLDDAVVCDEEEERHDHDGDCDDLSTSKTTTTGIQSKKKEDNDTGNISIELTRTFYSVDDDLAEDVDTNLDDAVVCDEEEEIHDHDGDCDDLSTSKTTTTGIPSKEKEGDPDDISVELTRTFDSVDVDLVEDVDTDLEDAVVRDDEEEGHDLDDGDDLWHMTVENVISEIMKEQQEQEYKSVVAGPESIASFLISCPFLTSVLLSLLFVEIILPPADNDEEKEDINPPPTSSSSTSIDDILPPPPSPVRHSIHYSVLLPTDNDDDDAPPSPIRRTINYWEEKSLHDSISSNSSLFDIPSPPTTGRLSASQLYLFEDDDHKRNIGPIDLDDHVDEELHETSLDDGYKTLPRMSTINHDSVTSLTTPLSTLSTPKFGERGLSTRQNRRSLRNKSGGIRHSHQRTTIIAILCITIGISFVDYVFDYCETQSIFHNVHDTSLVVNVIVDDKNNSKSKIKTLLVISDEKSSSSPPPYLMEKKRTHQQQRQHHWDEHIVSTFL